MTIQARAYTDDDLPRLQAALASWIQEAGDCGYCHVGDIPHRIYNGIRGRLPVRDLVRVWEDDSSIIGMVIVEPFYNGFDVFVSPAYRGSEYEMQMLQWADETTRHYVHELEREDKSLNCDVDGGDEIRARLVRQLGYEANEQWLNVTERSLSIPIPEPILPEGFTIRSATLADYEQLTAVHCSAFNSTWTPEQYRDEVMLKPGYNAEREIVVVAPDGQFAAFTVTWLDTVNKVGLFEPVGTHQDFQRKGLGKAMMFYTLREMKVLGMETAMVGHGTDNPASTALYHSVGFRTKYEVTGYKKL